jgi:osmotically-inducible protein OsmY
MSQARPWPFFLLILMLPLVLGAAATPTAEPCCSSAARHVEIFTGLSSPAAATAATAGTGTAERAARDEGAPRLAQSASKPIPAKEPVTDAFIAAMLRIEFERRSALRDLKLGFKVDGGVVQLSGLVDTREQADLAVKTARDVDGVTAVVNKLELRR